MDIERKLLLLMSDKSNYDVYLREIALLMEENETLRGKVKERDKLIKYYELERKKNN